MNFTVTKLEMYVQHIIAWWRGDFTSIVGKFDKYIKALEGHNAYLNLVAENQAHASRALAAASKAAYAEAEKAKNVAANFKALVQG